MQQQESILSKIPEDKYKVVLVGDTGVGKTTLFKRFLEEHDEIQDYTMKSSTLSQIIDFRIKTCNINNRPVKFYLWDTAGQERHRSMVSQYFKGCQGIILLFDVTKKESYESALNVWMPLCQEKTQKAVILLVGNKIDLQVRVCGSKEQLTQQFEFYEECSALDGANVQQIFEMMGKLIQIRMEKGMKQLKQLIPIDDKEDYREQAQISISRKTSSQLSTKESKGKANQQKQSCKC